MEIKTFIPEEIPGGNKTERGSDDMYFDERVNKYVLSQCEAHGGECNNKCEHYPFCRLVDIYTDAVEADLWAQYAGFDTTVNEADLAKLRAQLLPYVEVGADASPDEIGNYEMDTDVFPPETKLGTNPPREQAGADPVNHPKHYVQGGIECIDVIRAARGTEGCIQFCVGNAIKYLFRDAHKGRPLEDLKKAQWYINKAVELMKGE